MSKKLYRTFNSTIIAKQKHIESINNLITGLTELSGINDLIWGDYPDGLAITVSGYNKFLPVEELFEIILELLDGNLTTPIIYSKFFSLKFSSSKVTRL